MTIETKISPAPPSSVIPSSSIPFCKSVRLERSISSSSCSSYDSSSSSSSSSDDDEEDNHEQNLYQSTTEALDRDIGPVLTALTSGDSFGPTTIVCFPFF